MIVLKPASNGLRRICILATDESRRLDGVEINGKLVGIRYPGRIETGGEGQGSRVAAGARKSNAASARPKLPPSGLLQSLVGLPFVVIAVRRYFGRFKAELRVLGCDFHLPVRSSNRSLHGFPIWKDHVYRLVGLYGHHLIPRCCYNAELIGLDNEVLTILLDDAARDPVTVLQHHPGLPMRCSAIGMRVNARRLY